MESLIAARLRDEITPVPSEEAIENLKFGECLPPLIVGEVFGLDSLMQRQLPVLVVSQCEL